MTACARARAALALLTITLGVVLTADARADAAPSTATFALIVGANASVDPSLPVLKYADDDAARYLDLFRLLGARTYLLSRLDENTRRLHPQAVAEADEPKRAAFDRAVRQLTADVATASARGVETVVYFVYAGHGDVKNGEGYITLEDDRITGAELARVVTGVPATHVHVIVDACSSYFLAYSRGPGGERRALEGFHASALTEDPRVGVLLSTSSARESHEWEGFEGGVFSHEVRSGLYGAADADGDGQVSYREIAAFVARANAAIPNERFRPDVFARPPQGSDTLLDLRAGLRRRLVIDGAHAAHYFLEDARGVRLLDAHNAPGQALSLVRPAPGAAVYLTRAGDEHEFLVRPWPDVIALADLAEAEPRARARGAAHESFSLAFSLPFDEAVVESYRPTPLLEPSGETAPPRSASRRRLLRTVGWAGIGGGAAFLGLGTGLAIWSHGTAASISPADTEAAAASKDSRIRGLNASAVVAFSAGGAALAGGAVLLLWPAGSGNGSDGLRLTATANGGAASYALSF